MFVIQLDGAKREVGWTSSQYPGFVQYATIGGIDIPVRRSTELEATNLIPDVYPVSFIQYAADARRLTSFASLLQTQKSTWCTTPTRLPH